MAQNGGESMCGAAAKQAGIRRESVKTSSNTYPARRTNVVDELFGIQVDTNYRLSYAHAHCHCTQKYYYYFYG